MKPPVGERWGESRMSNFVSVIIGGFAAVCAWFGIEFLGKPFRTFFELKKEGLEVLARYSNVAARPEQVHPFPDNKIGLVDAPVHPRRLSPEEESRLKEAEGALRTCGSKFIAFAQTRGQRNGCSGGSATIRKRPATASSVFCANGCYLTFLQVSRSGP